MMRWAMAAFLVTALPPLPAAQARQVSAATLEPLRVADMQLATIGFRLSVAGAPFCDRLEPGTGLQLHTLAQYNPAARAQVRAYFRFAGPLAVEGVVPGSPAARAGVQADDTIVSLNGAPVSIGEPERATTAELASAYALFSKLAPAAPIELGVLRGGKRFDLRIVPTPACRTRFELRVDEGYDARANGDLVQITTKYIDSVDAALLPVLIAHELSHNILHHRERLAAAGAQFGLASGFGRNAGLFRQTEIEADILAVHLLGRAGYPPDIAAQFWREIGPRLLAGRIRSRSHPPIRDRVVIAETEAARFITGTPPPPSFVAARTEPLNGNWQQLIPEPAR